MTTARFNHMELTLPRGELGPSVRAEIDEFYGDLFGWKGMDVEVVGQDCHLLSVDEGQFILLTESDDPMSSPGYDHLGALMESREEVDAVLEKCRSWQEKDDRVQIKLYDDLVYPDLLTVHAFYVKHLLPIWFDVSAWSTRGPSRPGAGPWSATDRGPNSRRHAPPTSGTCRCVSRCGKASAVVGDRGRDVHRGRRVHRSRMGSGPRPQGAISRFMDESMAGLDDWVFPRGMDDGRGRPWSPSGGTESPASG